MSKYITLVFKYETDKDLEQIRKFSGSDFCSAWSLDHEMLRVDLVRKALEENNIEDAKDFVDEDGVIKHLHRLDITI